MADDLEPGRDSNGATSAEAAPSAEPSLILNTHYIKDLSFENPNAPQVYGELQKGPTIDVNIDVASSHVQEQLYEVVLKLSVKATIEGNPAFLVELDLAGLATIGQQVSDEARERLLYTEVPRYLFPFARAVVGDMTRDAGFPPLLINPISFEELYHSRKQADAEAAQASSA
jgi:preprotein translocase subunit SecB